jgi:hypothetical protein
VCLPSPKADKAAKAQQRPVMEAVKESYAHSATPDEILLQLTEGEISAKAAKLYLVSLMRTSSEKSFIQSCIDNVDGLAPAEDPKQKHTSNLPSVLQPKGKLCKLWSQCVTYIRTELHKNGKAEHKQALQQNVETMEITVAIKADEPIQSVSMFIYALEQFRHVVRSRDHLSELETHQLVSWCTKQLTIGTRLLAVERTFLELITMMDADMSQDLAYIIRHEARTILMDQEDILGSFPGTQENDADKRKTKTEKDKEAAAKRAQLPVPTPNDVCCWYDTNKITHPQKILVNGVCKHDAKHGICGVSDGKGGFCTAKHSAHDHKP